jgi:hypothetical protein
MGKQLNQEQAARYERHEAREFTNQWASRPSPLAQARLALTGSGEALLRREPGRRVGLVVLIAGLLLTGCASGDSTAEQERRGGFYGGVSGGMGSHP